MYMIVGPFHTSDELLQQNI